MTTTDAARPKGAGLAFAYVTTLFFAWGFITSLIDPLVAAVLMPLSSVTAIVGAWRGRTFARGSA